MLDSLTVTAHGTDGLPHWFLRIAAPSICSPVTHLFNLSIQTSIVPSQWKTSVITPVSKTKQPTCCSDFRPISITPILSRLLERIVVRNYIYPILVHPDTNHLFLDQFAFRPTGSPTSAVIHLSHRISELLQEHKYVHVIALDFSKAFDTVRHNTLMQKMAKFPLPDHAYNWVADFLLNRKHLTRFEQTLSTVLAINASIIQGSVTGPTAYVLNASDLKTIEPSNSLDKYADDTYLIVPASNSHTIPAELDNVSAWAAANNLSLNVAKSCEMIVRRPRLAINDPSIPPALPEVKRVSELNILGVRMSDRLEFTPHINHITTAAVQSTYALRVLRAHGLCGPRLWEVARATAVSKLTYACSAWWGFADSSGRSRLQAVINKLVRLGFLSGKLSFAQICQEQDDNLFSQILSNEHHVLHQLLPPVRNTPYSLRPRAHDRELPLANTTMRKNFIVRMLYSKL